MASTQKKLEDVYSSLSATARAWLLSGKITLDDAETMTQELMSEDDVFVWVKQHRFTKPWIQEIYGEAMPDSAHLINDILAWELINPIATEMFMQGKLTLEQMRMAAALHMGRRRTRMLSMINDPDMVPKRRAQAKKARKEAAARRLPKPQKQPASYRWKSRPSATLVISGEEIRI